MSEEHDLDPSDIVVQEYFQTTCIECEELKWFILNDTDMDELVNKYNCNECGHTLKVDL